MPRPLLPPHPRTPEPVLVDARALLEAAPDAVVVVDARGIIVLVNARVEEVFGWRREELVGLPIEVLVPHGARKDHHRLRDRFTAQDRPLRATRLPAVRLDGSEFVAEISLATLRTRTGVLVSAAVRDVGERIEAEEEAQRLKEELVATVSHELRTPLTSILGYAELLQDLGEADVSPRARAMLAVVERNARRELELVDDLLTLSDLSRGRVQLERVACDLAPVLAAAVLRAAPAAETAGLSLEVVAEEAPPVLADAERVGQVLDDLLDNAVKFTPRGGRVVARLRGGGTGAVLEVEDTGVGVTEQERLLLFERLWRAPSAVAAQKRGAGLGLAIVKALVLEHGGTVDVESVPGGGSTFRVVLPRGGVPEVVPHPAQDGAQDSERTATTASGGTGP